MMMDIDEGEIGGWVENLITACLSLFKPLNVPIPSYPTPSLLPFPSSGMVHSSFKTEDFAVSHK